MRQTLQHKLKFKDGLALYIGKGIRTNPHRHYALEIVFSYDKLFQIITPDRKYSDCKFAIIPKNIKHQFIGNTDDFQVFIYIDPFHQLAVDLENKWNLSSSIITNFTTLNKIILPSLKEWQDTDENNLLETLSSLVQQMAGRSPIENNTDHRISKSFQHIYNNLNETISIKTIASSIFLSESRYAHLFKLQVGIPFRRYVLWLRMQKTIQSIIEGNSLTSACYAGGFSDLPHFNKAFKDMFGITPSAVLKG